MVEFASRRLVAFGATALVAMCVGSASCRRAAPALAPMATPSVKLNHDKAPLGSPLDITYRFEVSGAFDQDYRVLVHVLDPDGELMWNDDHMPPVPTSQWKPGQAVEYTRTIFVPIFPYVGEASIRLGMFSTATQKRLPLTGEDAGQREYNVGRVLIQPQTENIFTTFAEGWHETEMADHNAMVQWQWTKKTATLKFRSPQTDCVFYLEADNPGKPFTETQQVTITLGGEPLDTFTLAPGQAVLRKVPLPKARLGPDGVVEIQIAVDKTFVPAAVDPIAYGKDQREVGIRVYHAFVDRR